MSDIKSQTMRIIAEELGIEDSQVTMEATLDDLGADSLDEVSLIVEIENQLDVNLDLNEVDAGLSVAQIVALVEAAAV